MNAVLASIRAAARGREVVCPDESKLPTGTLRQAGFVMMKPDDFYAAARAARAGRQANRPTARQQLAVSGRTFPEALSAIVEGKPLPGKTERDRASGATARRAENRVRRNADCQARRGRAGAKPNPGKQTA